MYLLLGWQGIALVSSRAGCRWILSLPSCFLLTCRAVTTALLIAPLFAGTSCSRIGADNIFSHYEPDAQYAAIYVRYPLHDVVFPPEIVPPRFRWEDAASSCDSWAIGFEFDGEPDNLRLQFLSTRNHWTPEPKDWKLIKERSRKNGARLIILGFQRGAPQKILSRGEAAFSTSADPVSAPLFYREVNLPFLEAVKDPTRIRWRLGTIDDPRTPLVVLECLPVCGNCHSFSQDGRTLGMDVDYANNKASYVITQVEREMTLAASDIITWSDYRKDEPQQTYGFLSQVSPDGRFVVSTVKDKSVFVAKQGLAFSQLFFPIQGILVVYDRTRRCFQALPGADDPGYVQSNPAWSPDGKHLVFARAKAYQLQNRDAEGKVLLSASECAEFLEGQKLFQFDLYVVPFNEGRGGVAEPLPGASRNGRSNFFPKFSPDGKWIVFCQARSYMLLQPDSELFIIPAEGGEARRLRANTASMNSWHSWSPNSRWLVFSSKANTPYTQLFLTHIDENGESSPPVLLEHFTAPDRAANIPEFLNAPPDAITKISEQFLNDNSYTRAGYVLEQSGENEAAIAKYQKALQVNPRNVHAHQRLGFLLYHTRRQFETGLSHTAKALELDPRDGCARFDLGVALTHQGKYPEAVLQLQEALKLLPEGFGRRYAPVEMLCALGDALAKNAQVEEAVRVLGRAVELDPEHARSHYILAIAQAAQGLVAEPLEHHAKATSLQPEIDNSADLHLLLSINCERAGHLQEALRFAEIALRLARAGSDLELIQILQDRVSDLR